MMNSSKKSIFLFETIKIQNGNVLNLDFHIKRAQNSVLNELKFDFAKILKPKTEGIYRAKVIYDQNGELVSVEYFPYKMRDFYEFKLVNISFSYDKKYLDRSDIEKAKNGFDEIIMMKNSLITDTSIANLAIFDESLGLWLTPKTPLLKGTSRQRLLQNGFLTPKDISKNELLNAKKIALMNAMIGFVELDKFKII